MLNMEKPCVFMNFNKTLIRYSSPNSSIKSLAAGFLLCSPSGTITGAVRAHHISFRTCFFWRSFDSPLYFPAASWWKVPGSDTDRTLLSLRYTSPFWEELKAHWLTWATTNVLLLTRILQAGTIAGFRGRFEVTANNWNYWNNFCMARIYKGDWNILTK